MSVQCRVEVLGYYEHDGTPEYGNKWMLAELQVKESGKTQHTVHSALRSQHNNRTPWKGDLERQASNNNTLTNVLAISDLLTCQSSIHGWQNQLHNWGLLVYENSGLLIQSLRISNGNISSRAVNQQWTLQSEGRLGSWHMHFINFLAARALDMTLVLSIRCVHLWINRQTSGQGLFCLPASHLSWVPWTKMMGLYSPTSMVLRSKCYSDKAFATNITQEVAPEYFLP